MKTLMYSLAAGFVFAGLFHGHRPGLNVLLLALVTTALILVNQHKRPVPLFPAAAYVYSAFFCFLSPEPLALLIHVLCFILLGGAYATGKTSLYIQGLAGITNLPLGILLGLTEGWAFPREHRDRVNRKIGTVLGGVAISMLLVGLFGALYAVSNPVFSDLLDAIDLSFMSPAWIGLLVLGTLVYRNLLAPYDPSRLTAADAEFGNALLPPEAQPGADSASRIDRELLYGKMALWALNTLLLFFLVLDVYYLAQGPPDTAMRQSEAVHQGVYALIVSLVLAMAVVTVLFRGSLNFYPGGKTLKRLAYAWLFLNTVLLGNTALKNAYYVVDSGLTFKRLGVFLFLTLVLSGLWSVSRKIRDKKSVVYLLRVNSAVAFAVLTAMLSLPWNQWITAYNLKFIKEPDMRYLLQLDPANAPVLNRYLQVNGDRVHWETAREIRMRYRDYREAQQALDWPEWNAGTLKFREP